MRRTASAHDQNRGIQWTLLNDLENLDFAIDLASLSGTFNPTEQQIKITYEFYPVLVGSDYFQCQSCISGLTYLLILFTPLRA